MTTTKFNWKMFLVLLGACAFGVVAILPYSITLQGGLERVRALTPVPLEVLLPLQILQNLILFAVAIAAGLFFAGRVGLGLPILEAALAKQPVREQLQRIWLPSILLGVLAAGAIVGLDVLFQPLILRELGGLADLLAGANAQPPAWQGLLASFYGGINEEVLLRLLVLSFLAWLGKFLAHDEQGRPRAAVLWGANLLAAILFGLGHLPTLSALAPLTPLLITRTVLLNAVGGVAFGYLYTSRGLESAMLAHFSADIVLHVLLAL